MLRGEERKAMSPILGHEYFDWKKCLERDVRMWQIEWDRYRALKTFIDNEDDCERVYALKEYYREWFLSDRGEEHSRLIGITKDALNLLKENEFRNCKGIKKQYIQDRKYMVEELLSHDFSGENIFLNYLRGYNTSVLCTNSECVWKGDDHHSGIIRFREYGQSTKLFAPKKKGNASWHYGKLEKDFLIDFYIRQLKGGG